MSTKKVTGKAIRSELAKTLQFAGSASRGAGMDKDQIAAGKLLCSTANSITSNLAVELRARAQEMQVGTPVENIPNVGDFVMA